MFLFFFVRFVFSKKKQVRFLSFIIIFFVFVLQSQTKAKQKKKMSEIGFKNWKKEKKMKKSLQRLQDLADEKFTREKKLVDAENRLVLMEENIGEMKDEVDGLANELADAVEAVYAELFFMGAQRVDSNGTITRHWIGAYTTFEKAMEFMPEDFCGTEQELRGVWFYFIRKVTLDAANSTSAYNYANLRKNINGRPPNSGVYWHYNDVE
jgi:hypothetical protein